MTYTPYPYANGEEENPSIAVSNDLYAWVTLDGMVNPIADNEETGCRELKDPHILYRDDLDRIEIWYLGRVSQQLGGDGTSLTLFRKYSTDGIIWSDYEVMSTVEYLSPVLACLGYTYLRIQLVAARSVLALVLTSLLEGICIYCVSDSLVRAFSGGK